MLRPTSESKYRETGHSPTPRKLRPHVGIRWADASQKATPIPPAMRADATNRRICACRQVARQRELAGRRRAVTRLLCLPEAQHRGRRLLHVTRPQGEIPADLINSTTSSFGSPSQSRTSRWRRQLSRLRFARIASLARLGSKKMPSHH